jgi:type I restriction enzyme S subunit
MWMRQCPLAECLRLSVDVHRVQPDQTYQNLGIYSFGRGLFLKPPIDGVLTSATTLNRVKRGQFIYSRLFAFEGAYGVVSDEYDGFFVSNEYPTFDCINGKVRAEFLSVYFKSPSVWHTVAVGSKGLGDRRQRVQPQQILDHVLWLPPIGWQNQVIKIERQVRSLAQYQSQSATALGTLIPTIIDRSFGYV